MILAWTSAFAEELFFRGFFVNSLRKILGDSRPAVALTLTTTTLVFAAAHGYQGWSGVIDSGLYGGLTLTLLFLWRARLTACVFAHASWNTIAAIVVYLWY